MYGHPRVVIVKDDHGAMAAGTIKYRFAGSESLTVSPDVEIHPVQVRIDLILDLFEFMLLKPHALAFFTFINADTLDTTR